MSYSQIPLAVRVGSSNDGTIRVLVASLTGADMTVNTTTQTPVAVGNDRGSADPAGDTFVGYTSVFEFTGQSGTFAYAASQSSNEVTGSVLVDNTTANRSYLFGSCDKGSSPDTLPTISHSPSGMYGYARYLSEGGGDWPLSGLFIVDDVTYADDSEIDDSTDAAYTGRLATGVPRTTLKEYDYALCYFAMLGLLADPGVSDMFPRIGHSSDRQWVYQNLTHYLMWGDHEFINGISFDTVTSAQAQWTPGKGVWDDFYNGMLPDRMNAGGVGHTEAQNFLLDYGNTLVVVLDNITKGAGAGDTAVMGATQVAEILAAAADDKWDFVIVVMSNEIRYMQDPLTTAAGTTEFLANATLADEKPTEYATLFTATGALQDLADTHSFNFLTIHGDHHNPSVINHENTGGVVDEEFTAVTTGTFNGSTNFTTDATVITANSPFRGSTIIYQDESRKAANESMAIMYRWSTARVDLLNTTPKKLVVTLVDDGWDEVWVGEYQAGQATNLPGPRTPDVFPSGAPTLTRPLTHSLTRSLTHNLTG